MSACFLAAAGFFAGLLSLSFDLAVFFFPTSLSSFLGADFSFFLLEAEVGFFFFFLGFSRSSNVPNSYAIFPCPENKAIFISKNQIQIKLSFLKWLLWLYLHFLKTLS